MLPAHHWSRRGLFDYCATLWGSFVLTVRGLRVYHAGAVGAGEAGLTRSGHGWPPSNTDEAMIWSMTSCLGALGRLEIQTKTIENS